MSMRDILLNLLLSFTASFFFWILSFKISLTNVIFSTCLAKPENAITDLKHKGLRVRFANIGLRDLIEGTMVIKMVINEDTRGYIFFLDISNSGTRDFTTVLPGRISNMFKEVSNIRTVTFYPSDSMQHELSKKVFPKQIRMLAKKGKVQFEDIFKVYGERVTFTVFFYGNDKTTGARKMFESPKYTMNNIEEGNFIGAKAIRLSFFNRKKIKRKKLSILSESREVQD